MKNLRKRWLLVGGAALGFYLLGFIVLWLGGGYVLTESGKVRVLLGTPTSIAAPDVAEWQPLFGHFQPYYTWSGGDVSPRCDFIGWMYYPMWHAVRDSHKAVQLLDEEGMPIESITRPEGFKIHPLRGRELRTVLP